MIGKHVDVLRDIRDDFMEDDSVDPVDIAALTFAIAELSDRAEARKGNTPIAELIADYESNGCDHSDMAWVRRAALHYVDRMQDSQVRCLLYTLASTPAEAQACECGKTECVEPWEPGCDLGKSEQHVEVEPVAQGNWVRGLKPDGTPLPPPSAPVGVEDITDEEIAEWEAERGNGMISCVGEYTPDEFWRVLDELKRLRALAQQPAACVGCEGNPTPENNPCAVCGQQSAAVDDLNAWRTAFIAERAARYREGGMAIEQARIHAETDATRIAANALAAQPGGSDNE